MAKPAKPAKPRGRKPDYWVKAMQAHGEKLDAKGKIGAAWTNEDGSISIDLNPFVVLEAHPALHITLFPNNSTLGYQKPSEED